MQKQFILLLLTLSSFLLSSCALEAYSPTHDPLHKEDKGGSENKKSPPKAADPGRLAVFENTVYAYTRTNCRTCHGVDQAPLFAVDDKNAAYDMSKRLVNFQNIPSSRLVGRTMDSHCGVNCNTNGADLEAAILNWWENAESGNDSTPTRPAAGTLSGLEAFKVSVFPYLQVNCAQCHGSGTGPQFAVSNAQTSYSRTLNRVNLNNLTNSELYRKSKSDHENCGTPCQTDGTQMRAELEYWFASE